LFLTFSHVRREHARWQKSAEPGEGQLTGVLKSMPISGIILLLGGLGLVGSPPFNIFFSEFIILWGALERIVQPPAGQSQLLTAAYVLAVGLFLLTITLIFGGLVGHLARLLLDRPPAAQPPFRERWAALAPLLVLLGIITLFGVWIPTTPVDFPRLLEQSVHILQQGAGGP
jgi:hydrogenase-4 component F